MLGRVFMGLFSKKSKEKKRAENKIDELCGGFLGNDVFNDKVEKNNLDKSTSNVYYKSILKNEIKNNTLNYEDIEDRLDELFKLDVDALNNKIKYKEDTSLFKTQQDINDFLGEEYTDKHNRSLEKARAKELEKERKKAQKEEEKRIKNLEKERRNVEKEEEKRIKELKEKRDKIKKLEDKFNVVFTGKTWFECGIEEIKYSTFQNEARRDYDHAYVIINEDNIEIMKESPWIKSNMGTRKIFYENITSIDFDARGRRHASSSIIINTKSSEHIQLKFVDEKYYELLNNAFEDHIRKPKEIATISQSSKADDLARYAELYEKGFISEQEFHELKNEVIHGKSGSGFDEYEESEHLNMNNNFCPNCGAKVLHLAKFCPSCGNKLN